jgi:hypothetical protein
VLFTVVVSGSARAQQIDDGTRSAARQLATDGSAAYQASDFAQAYDRFNRAYQLVRVPTLGIWAARSLVKLGRLVEASERYLEVERSPLAADAPPEHLKAQKDATVERNQLLPRIPNVRVILAGAEPSQVFVSLNDELLQAALVGVKRPVDPGKYRVKGVRGEQVAEATLELAEGETRDVTLTFAKISAAPSVTAPPAAPLPAPPLTTSDAAPDHTLSFVVLGVGGAALITGGIFGGLAWSQKSDLAAECPDRQCPPAHHADNNSYGTKKTVASIGLIGGAALVGAGLVLYFTAPSRSGEQQARLGAFYDGQTLGVRGGF